ncbi:MAG: hypothetical protein ABIU77_18520 [Ferruginibacter sp.]
MGGGQPARFKYDIDQGMIYIEDYSREHTWKNSRKYIKAFDHPLWKKNAAGAVLIFHWMYTTSLPGRPLPH